MRFESENSLFRKPGNSSQLDLKSVVNTVVTNVRDKLSTVNKIDTKLPMAYLTKQVSNESYSVAEEHVNNLYDATSSAITLIEKDMLTTTPGMRITEAQRRAAELITPIAMNISAYGEALERLQPPITQQEIERGNLNVSYVGAESFNIDTIDPRHLHTIMQSQLSTEAYDGQQVNNALYYSVAYNLGAARQDEFAEAFFPTITMDPLKSGVSVSIEFTSLFKEYTRKISGETSDPEKIPVIKTIFDNNIFGTDRNAVVPVYRENENSNFFLKNYTFVDTSRGEPILTAPLKFGKKFDMLGISQTNEDIAKGMRDNTDALDRTINVTRFYFSFTNGDGVDAKTEMFMQDTRLMNQRHFIGRLDGHFKEMGLNFANDSVMLNISTALNALGKQNETFADIRDSYPNYNLVLAMAMSGTANTDSCEIVVNGTDISLVDVIDNNGSSLPKTSDAYVAIAALCQNIKLEGYTLEAFVTNSNLRQRGRLVTTDIYTAVYNVPLREGISAIFPTINFQGTDNDVGTLSAQITLAGVMTSAFAVKTLVETADKLKTAAENNSLDKIKFDGVSKYLVNNYYNEITISLAEIVDSVASSSRDNDIKAALLSNIRLHVNNMCRDSLYKAAHETLNQGNMGGKIGVVIGTDPILASILTMDGEVNIGEEYEVKIVNTLNPLIRQKIFVVFSSLDESTRNTVPNALSFGNCFWAPTITYEVTKTRGNSTSRELHNNPRFLHVVNTKIMTVFNIVDIQSVYSKVPTHIKTVGIVTR